MNRGGQLPPVAPPLRFIHFEHNMLSLLCHEDDFKF